MPTSGGSALTNPKPGSHAGRNRNQAAPTGCSSSAMTPKVPGLRPPHHVVRQLRLVHHVTDVALRVFRSPEGGCHEHLSQEGAIRSDSGANLNGHASS